jgi:glutaredoxin
MTWVKVDGKFNKRDVKIYSLSYCHACDKAKNYLKEKKITFRYLDIDLADSEERTEAAGLFGMDIPEGGISIAFPIILIDGKRIMGFDREKIANALEKEIGG